LYHLLKLIDKEVNYKNKGLGIMAWCHELQVKKLREKSAYITPPKMRVFVNREIATPKNIG
jgi:hypothetical protein